MKTLRMFASIISGVIRSALRQAMVGMLFAIPKTPLHARLAAAGRLDPDDDSPFGTNVIPAHLSRDALRDGYVRRPTSPVLQPCTRG